MNFRILWLTLLGLLTALPCHSQTITLDEFLLKIRQTHPFFVKESLSVEIEVKAQQRYLGARDWNLSAAPFFSHQKPIGSSLFSPQRIDVLGAEMAAEKALWKTGGRFFLSWSSQFSDQKLPDISLPTPSGIMDIPTGPSEFYEHKIYLTYSQPLWQNSKGVLDRLEYELSQYNIDFTEVQALENEEVFLVDLAARFLDWALITDQIRIANERTRLAQEELERTTKKREAYLVDAVDVLRAEDAVRIAKQNVVLLEAQWKSLQAELSVLCQSPEMCDHEPEFDLYKLVALPSVQEISSQLREQSRILKTLNIRREQLIHLQDGYAEQGRPQLFLNVGAGLQGGDDEFAGSLELDKPDMSVALLFRYPLENRTAQASIAKTDLEIQQLDQEIENIALDLEASVVNLLVFIKEMEKVLALNEEQITSAKAKTEEELNLYNQGRGDLTFVILGRDNEQQAKFTYAENAASYQKLILQYRALMDEFLIE